MGYRSTFSRLSLHIFVVTSNRRIFDVLSIVRSVWIVWRSLCCGHTAGPTGQYYRSGTSPVDRRPTRLATEKKRGCSCISVSAVCSISGLLCLLGTDKLRSELATLLYSVMVCAGTQGNGTDGVQRRGSGWCWSRLPYSGSDFVCSRMYDRDIATMMTR